MRPGFDEDWPDDGRPSMLDVNRLLDESALRRRRRSILSFIGILAIGFAIGECGKALGWW